jgi:hypothetical protein
VVTAASIDLVTWSPMLGNCTTSLVIICCRLLLWLHTSLVINKHMLQLMVLAAVLWDGVHLIVMAAHIHDCTCSPMLGG